MAQIVQTNQSGQVITDPTNYKRPGFAANTNRPPRVARPVEQLKPSFNLGRWLFGKLWKTSPATLAAGAIITPSELGDGSGPRWADTVTPRVPDEPAFLESIQSRGNTHHVQINNSATDYEPWVFPTHEVIEVLDDEIFFPQPDFTPREFPELGPSKRWNNGRPTTRRTLRAGRFTEAPETTDILEIQITSDQSISVKTRTKKVHAEKRRKDYKTKGGAIWLAFNQAVRPIGKMTEVMDAAEIFAWSIYGQDRNGNQIPAMLLEDGRYDLVLRGIYDGKYTVDFTGFLVDFAINKAEDRLIGTLSSKAEKFLRQAGYNGDTGVAALMNLIDRHGRFEDLSASVHDYADALTTKNFNQKEATHVQTWLSQSIPTPRAIAPSGALF